MALLITALILWFIVFPFVGILYLAVVKHPRDEARWKARQDAAWASYEADRDAAWAKGLPGPAPFEDKYDERNF